MLFKFLLDDVARKSPQPLLSDTLVELTDSNLTGLMRGSNRRQQNIASALSRTKSAPRPNQAVRYPFSPPRVKQVGSSMNMYPATHDPPLPEGSFQPSRLSLQRVPLRQERSRTRVAPHFLAYYCSSIPLLWPSLIIPRPSFSIIWGYLWVHSFSSRYKATIYRIFCLNRHDAHVYCNIRKFTAGTEHRRYLVRLQIFLQHYIDLKNFNSIKIVHVYHFTSIYQFIYHYLVL